MRPEQASTYKRVMAPTTSLTAIRSKGVIEQATVLSSAAKTVDVFEGYEWELYNIKDDFSESENLAEKHPDKLGELQRLFYIEAVKHDVLPLDNSKVKRLDVKNRPSLTEGRDKFVYYDGGGLGKGGTATLSVDAETVATEKIPRTIPFRMSLDETLNIGEDTGTPVNEDYQVPFDFTGEIEKLTIQISDHKLTEEQLHKYREKQVEAALSR